MTCINKFYVSGSKEELNKFIETVNAPEEGTALSLNTLVPRPIDFTGEDWLTESIWYEENWGTWGDVQATLENRDDYSAFYNFESAWTAPVEWLSRVSKIFTDIDFKLEYDCTDSLWMGIVLAESGRPFLHRCLCYQEHPSRADLMYLIEKNQIFEFWKATEATWNETNRLLKEWGLR